MAMLKLQGPACPILIGQNLVANRLWVSSVQGHQVCIVTNDCVAPLYLSSLEKALPDCQVDVFILQDGETHKNMEQLQAILRFLLAHKHQRSTTVVGLGGGVVLDIAGFAASVYLRGVNWISIPTTLLAQVDAAIGGKTGVNFEHAKNMIGSFYHPEVIVIDSAVLKTLPDREFRAGLAEMVKHAIILDANYFDYLENNIQKILSRDAPILQEAIAKSIEIKTRIVMQDEKEKNIRALLNFGHTIGHALEAITDYQYLHGEAVAIGIMEELSLSKKYGLPEESALRIKKLFKEMMLPVELPSGITRPQLKSLMMVDKKRTDIGWQLPIIVEIGRAYMKEVDITHLIGDPSCEY